jgi:hypothetical protein
MSEALKATQRVRSIQRAALAMLVKAGVINYIDRATLAVANLMIRQDHGLSIADIGLASAGSYLSILDRPITAADLNAVSQQGAAPLPARGA